jgi:hypothetical protein
MKAKPNNVHDALMADGGIRGGYVLATDDTGLEAVIEQQGGVLSGVVVCGMGGLATQADKYDIYIDPETIRRKGET